MSVVGGGCGRGGGGSSVVGVVKVWLDGMKGVEVVFKD